MGRGYRGILSSLRNTGCNIFCHQQTRNRFFKKDNLTERVGVEQRGRLRQKICSPYPHQVIQMKCEKTILDWLAKYVDDVTTAEAKDEKVILRCNGNVVGILVFQRLVKQVK